MNQKEIKQKVLKEFRWEENKTKDSQQIANTFAKYVGVNNIHKMHNEDLEKAIDLTIKETAKEIFEELSNSHIDNENSNVFITETDTFKELKKKWCK